MPASRLAQMAPPFAAQDARDGIAAHPKLSPKRCFADPTGCVASNDFDGISLSQLRHGVTFSGVVSRNSESMVWHPTLGDAVLDVVVPGSQEQMAPARQQSTGYFICSRLVVTDAASNVAGVQGHVPLRDRSTHCPFKREPMDANDPFLSAHVPVAVVVQQSLPQPALGRLLDIVPECHIQRLDIAGPIAGAGAEARGRELQASDSDRERLTARLADTVSDRLVLHRDYSSVSCPRTAPTVAGVSCVNYTTDQIGGAL